jgi:hypothetical protein
MEALRNLWKGLFLTALSVSALCGVQNVAAQEDGFFFDVGGDYLTRAIAKHTATPALLGGHLGLGYSLWRFDMSAEAGISTSQEGANPQFSGVAESVSGLQVPVLLKGAFDLMPDSQFKLKPELFFGANYTDTTLIVRDKTVNEVSSWDILGGAGIRAGYQFGQNFGLYLGAYFDYRFDASDFANSEKQSANFQFRVGVQIHPFGGGASSPSKKTTTRPTGKAQLAPYGGGGGPYRAPLLAAATPVAPGPTPCCSPHCGA